MTKLTGFFTELMRKYLPDPFVFCIVLTFLTAILAILIGGKGPLEVVNIWGKGFWSLLAFTTQMAVILAMGYVLATAPVTDRLLEAVISTVSTPRSAVIVATLVGGIGSYLNWGVGLVIGAVVAKKLALRVKGVHYPLIIAAAYSGFTLYGFGLSSTIPILISTAGHPLEKQMGIVPLSDTIFAWPMLLTSLVLIVTLPLLNAWLHPAPGEAVVEIDRAAEVQETRSTAQPILEADTLANKLNNSRILGLLTGLLGIIYAVYHFSNGGSLDFNMINFIVLFAGIILLGSPAAYVARLSDGIKTIAGMILQYPFYSGIMAIMAGAGLVSIFSKVFVDVATMHTLPFWGLISSYFINFFVPGAGGHWVIQGPFMVEAAKTLGAPMNQTAMAVMIGNAWNDLIQPFWLLPTLALSNLKLRDIMGYTVIMMLWVGVIDIVAVLGWSFLGQ